jgi:hypothetical protein
MAGLVRPDGPVRIEKTKVISKDVLVAKLSGSLDATVGIAKRGEDFYVALPPSMGGGVRKIAADSLTDCLHQAVHEMNEKLEDSGKRNDKVKSSAGGCKV